LQELDSLRAEREKWLVSYAVPAVVGGCMGRRVSS
jgi:hypothetical protein